MPDSITSELLPVLNDRHRSTINHKEIYKQARELSLLVNLSPNLPRRMLREVSEGEKSYNIAGLYVRSLQAHEVNKKTSSHYEIKRRSFAPEFPRQDAHRNTFLGRAQRLDGLGQIDAALDLIYDSIDEILRHGQFSKLDSLLEQTLIEDQSTDLLLGLLTSTLPARSKLSSRKKFFSEVEVCLENREELEDGLLTGLE